MYVIFKKPFSIEIIIGDGFFVVKRFIRRIYSRITYPKLQPKNYKSYKIQLSQDKSDSFSLI